MSLDVYKRQVMDEDIIGLVGVIGDEVAGVGVEGHVAAVAGDRGSIRHFVALYAGRTDRDAGRHARLPITDEDVVNPVCVPGDEVRGLGLDVYKRQG